MLISKQIIIKNNDMNFSFTRFAVFTILLFLLIPITAFSQVTKVRGKVTDIETKEPLPFVNVSFVGTTIGCITDFNGEYFLETRTSGDSLQASYIGYNPQTFGVKKNQFQTINFELQSSNTVLEEITIEPGENPAHPILRNIIKNKDKNREQGFESLEYEAYNKMEFDINNIDDDFKKQKLLKDFQFVFDYMDTSAVTGKNYLPVFISETLSDFYYKKDPKAEKEYIKASKISGIENESVVQFTGQMYLAVNEYDSYMNIFGKSFVSPIANKGLWSYKYYLVDSSSIDGNWCYQISFKPRRKQELTFTGDFWVHDTTFAIKKMKLRIAEDANINFVNDMVITHEYEQVDEKYWIMNKETMFADFNLSDKNLGFFGRRTTIKKGIKINKPIKKPEKIFANATLEKVKVLDDAQEKDKDYWSKMRPDSLSQRELGIYNMIDSIQEVPIFRTYVDVITLIVSGYKDVGKIDIGPYTKLYSFNHVEGHRFRFGARTSTKFSEKFFVEGYLAYGTKDKEWKYGGDFKYYFKKTPFHYVGASYKKDMEQLGQSPYALSTDNILTSVFSRSDGQKLSMVREAKLLYGKEWFLGFSNEIQLIHRTLYPFEDLKFNTITDNGNVSYNRILSSEVRIKTRFAFDEKFIIGKRKRTSLGTDFPILSFTYGYGMKGVLESDFEYHKLNVSLKHKFNLNPIGKTEYYLEAGKIFGELPYPLLEIHRGNETYWYDDYSFSLMNYYEFASDKYVALFLTHYFEGLFFNKIPLFRKLKWREVVSGKAIIGRISDKNKKFTGIEDHKLELGEGSDKFFINELTEPYVEVSAGIENILKLFRVDALWRLTYLDNPDISKFGIRVKMNIKF